MRYAQLAAPGQDSAPRGYLRGERRADPHQAARAKQAARPSPLRREQHAVV